MLDSKTEIKKVWRIISATDPCILELRAIWPTGLPSSRPTLVKHFKSTDYNSLDECKANFESTALELNHVGYNIYAVMNPIALNFSGKAVSDKDIIHRAVLLIDIDRTGSKSAPATDSEIHNARCLAEEVLDFMDSQNWPSPIQVLSGNGYHLYYPIPGVPNVAKATNFIKELLQYLHESYSNDIVEIDTTVFNASRITKVVGTIARKGIESSERPYRMARVL
jgi:hypothetical protein